jgi:hypothetical protein
MPSIGIACSPRTASAEREDEGVHRPTTRGFWQLSVRWSLREERFDLLPESIGDASSRSADATGNLRIVFLDEGGKVTYSPPPN